MNLYACAKNIIAKITEKKFVFILFLLCFFIGIILRIIFRENSFVNSFYVSYCNRYVYYIFERRGGVAIIFFSHFFGRFLFCIPFLLPFFNRWVSVFSYVLIVVRGYAFACSAAVLCSSFPVVGVFVFIIAFAPVSLAFALFICAITHYFVIESCCYSGIKDALVSLCPFILLSLAVCFVLAAAEWLMIIVVLRPFALIL